MWSRLAEPSRAPTYRNEPVKKTASKQASAQLLTWVERFRDIAILVADTLSAETVRGTIRAAGPSTLTDIREFDRYQGKGIPEGHLSLALRLTFQAPDRTLTDAEVQTAMERIVGALKTVLGAVQR